MSLKGMHELKSKENKNQIQYYRESRNILQKIRRYRQSWYFISFTPNTIYKQWWPTRSDKKLAKEVRHYYEIYLMCDLNSLL